MVAEMSVRSAFLLLAVAAVLAAMAPGALAGEENEWQLWSAFTVRAKVTDDFGVFVTPQLRYKDDFDTWYYERYDLGLSFNLGERWRIEPFYSRLEKKLAGDWNVSDLASLQVYYKTPLGFRDLDFENRVRFETNFDNEREAGRERVKFSRELPWVEGGSVFVSDELIYDFSGGNFKENRLRAGYQHRFKCGFSTEVAFQLTSVRSAGHWEDFNTLVVNFGYSI